MHVECRRAMLSALLLDVRHSACGTHPKTSFVGGGSSSMAKRAYVYIDGSRELPRAAPKRFQKQGSGLATEGTLAIINVYSREIP